MIVQDYYNAWITEDEEVLRNLLDDSLFGVRTYHKEVLFDKEEVLTYLLSKKIDKVSFDSVLNQENTYLYTLNVTEGSNTFLVSGKLRTNNDKIIKLYETIQEDVTRYKCVCSYDGSSYYGYQKQDKQKTIQGTIEQAIQEAFSLEEAISIHGSGRTDKGVHANNQVFHFDSKISVPVSKMANLLNSYLPDSIYIKDIREVEQTFHSRYDIASKEYKYIINHKAFNPIMRQYEWFVKDLDITRFESVLQQVIGTHDFQSFTKASNDSTIRTITSVRIEKNDTHCMVYIKGNGFLRYMVRYIIGAAVSIARNKIPYTMSELLQQKDVTLLKDMAPASGLYLHNIEYE